MSDKPKFFSDADLKILQRVIDREKRQIVNSPPMQVTDRWDAGEDHQAPETYVALPPSGGIPAGDDTYATGDEPGAAECDIYQIISESGTPKLRPVTGLKKTVYNVGAEIDQVWTPVMRDKFGKWLAMVGGSSSSSPAVSIVRFVLTNADCATHCATGTVMSVVCGGDEGLIGSELSLYDAMGCHLTGNELLLVGLPGYAIKMIGDDPCPGTGTWTGIGTTTATESGCTWEIMVLCCPTESCG